MCMHFLCFVSSVHLVFEGSFCFGLFFCLFLQQARKKAEFGRMGGGEDLSGDKERGNCDQNILKTIFN